MVLVVDDDESIRATVQFILEQNGMRALTAASAREALFVAEVSLPDLVILDIQLTDKSGMDVLRELRERYPDLGVIMFTVVKESATVVEAIKLGALDYLTKDFTPTELGARVSKALKELADSRELSRRRAESATEETLPFISGPSPAMREVMQVTRRVAGLPTTVLISGEGGTGKEALACFIHQTSNRRNGPFVPVDLSVLARDYVERTLFGIDLPGRTTIGRFELADTGTIFLDEVAALTPEAQSRLLRVVEEGEVDRLGGSRPIKVDFRLVCATGHDLQKLVSTGNFNADLYFRLAVQPINLPPLRERKEDIEALATYFLKGFAQRYHRPAHSLGADAIESLKRHPWKGNVRELRNLMERLAINAESENIGVDELPEEMRSTSDGDVRERTLNEAVAAFEAELIRRALRRSGGDKRAAAAALGIGYSTLRAKLRLYGLSTSNEDSD